MAIKIQDKALWAFINPEYVSRPEWEVYTPLNEVCSECFTEKSWEGGCWCDE